MKKFLSLIMVVCILFVSAPYTIAADPEIVLNDGYDIVIASDNLKTAADKFADYIQKITGFLPYVVSSTRSDDFIKVTIDRNEIESGYTTVCKNGDIYITGSSLQWAVRGMYGFLQKFGGIEMYTSKLTVYKNSEIKVPADLNEKYVPYFEYTDTDWLSPCDVEYSLFNGLNSGEYRSIPDEMGGDVEYISGFAHTLGGEFCSREKYYEEHPEYFAKFCGVSTSNQLCLSNPEVYEIVRDEVFALLKEKHNPAEDLQIISLTQGDNVTYCNCKKCRETDHKYGSHAGTMLEFINAIARDVKAAGYDNVAIDTFAYRYTRTPPKGIVPEDNVIIRLCSIECCFTHAFDDETCKTNVEFMRDLEGWSKICNRIYIWDYCTNFSNFVGLFPNFGVLQRNMQIFYEHNVKGVYEEGNYAMKSESEFGELRSYLISKLLQNPYCDYEGLMKEFNSVYYGDGAPYIDEFLEIITNNAPQKHLGIYELQENTLSLSLKEIKHCDELWEKAEAATSGEQNYNVRCSEQSWRWWKMRNHASEFMNPITYKQNKTELENDIINSGTERFYEVEASRAYFNSILQSLYFKAYGIVSIVLKIFYSA